MPGLTLSLASHLTSYNLLTLIRAVSGYANTAPTVRELLLEADPGNAAAKVDVGGADVSTSNFGYQLTAGQSNQYRSDRNNVPMGDIWLVSDVDAAKVDVSWQAA